MLFRSAAVISALAASTVAGYSMIPDDMEIKAGSKFGQMIMGKARALENNQQDASWIANYSIKYHSCSSLIQIGDGEGGNNKDGGSALYTQNLIKFSLCPTNEGCDSCKTGVATYVVNMLDFIDAYTEAKLEEQEYACETVRENCYCADGNDDQYCENLCYTNAGLTDCIEYEGGDDFEIQRYLECAGEWGLCVCVVGCVDVRGCVVVVVVVVGCVPGCVCGVLVRGCAMLLFVCLLGVGVGLSRLVDVGGTGASLQVFCWHFSLDPSTT